MNKAVLAAVVVCLLGVLDVGISTDDCSGVRIGTLPTLYHKVRGELYVENDYTFCIQNFSYDGLGPDAFLYFYYPGDPFDETGGGVIINITTQASGRPQFDVNVAYTDEDYYRFTLPTPQFAACDFGGFSIWCRYANQLFTTLAWNNADIFATTDTSQRITCTPSPGRAYAGMLNSTSNTVSGQLYFVDNKTMAIRNFGYSSTSSDVFVYWFPPGTTPTNGGGNTIMLTGNSANSQTGAFSSSFNGSTDSPFMITITDNDAYACDIGTFTIWCQSCQTFFTMVPINLELFSNNPLEVAYEPNRILCNRTTTRPGLYINELPTEDARLISGSFYVVDQYTFFIQLFSFDTQEYEDVFLYYFPPGVSVNNDGSGGVKINISSTMNKFGTLKSESYYNQDFTVNLRLAVGGTVKACDVGYFAVWSEKGKVILTKMRIPPTIFYDSEDNSRPGAVLCASAGAVRIAMSSLLAMFLAVLAYAFAQ